MTDSTITVCLRSSALSIIRHCKYHWYNNYIFRYLGIIGALNMIYLLSLSLVLCIFHFLSHPVSLAMSSRCQSLAQSASCSSMCVHLTPWTQQHLVHNLEGSSGTYHTASLTSEKTSTRVSTDCPLPLF